MSSTKNFKNEKRKVEEIQQIDQIVDNNYGPRDQTSSMQITSDKHSIVKKENLSETHQNFLR